MAAPTATQVGSLGDGPNGNLTSVDKVTTYDAFVTDQWAYKRATMNLGLRFDHYDVWTPVATAAGATRSRPVSRFRRRRSPSSTT